MEPGSPIQLPEQSRPATSARDARGAARCDIEPLEVLHRTGEAAGSGLEQPRALDASIQRSDLNPGCFHYLQKNVMVERHWDSFSGRLCRI